MHRACFLYAMRRQEGFDMRKFAWTVVISAVTVLLVYMAGSWFDSLIPQ